MFVGQQGGESSIVPIFKKKKKYYSKEEGKVYAWSCRNTKYSRLYSFDKKVKD